MNARRNYFSESSSSFRGFDERDEFDCLFAENITLKEQILILEQEVKGLTDYQVLVNMTPFFFKEAVKSLEKRSI